GVLCVLAVGIPFGTAHADLRWSPRQPLNTDAEIDARFDAPYTSSLKGGPHTATGGQGPLGGGVGSRAIRELLPLRRLRHLRLPVRRQRTHVVASGVASRVRRHRFGR